ncbi:hypothetical protein T484DRAFT_3010111 [Baffinella frigidus]|nr:hypothetical protein T484DRAFT_3010111 [Cryptophyta sp. CCMP2293]
MAYTRNPKGKAKINSSLPFVELTNKVQCKTVYGVISNKEDYENTNRTYSVGGFNTSFKQDINDNRLIINAIGEGSIWVSNYNGRTAPSPSEAATLNNDRSHRRDR